MPDKTAAEVIDKEEVIEDGEQLTEEEAEQKAAGDFNKGFSRVAPPAADTSADAGKKDTEETDEEKAAQEAKDKAAQEEAEQKEAEAQAEQERLEKEKETFLETGSTRIRKVEGQVGDIKDLVTGLNRKLDELTKSGGATQKDKDEMAAELPSEEEIKELLEQYGEFKPLADKVEALRTRLDSMQAPESGYVSMEAHQAAIKQTRQETRELAKLDAKYGDWETTVDSEEFISFAMAGGPSMEDYIAYKRLESPQSDAYDPARAQEILINWTTAHPKWWGERGAVFMTGNTAKDAMPLLDAYAAQKGETRKAAADKKAEEQKRKHKRLEGAITPEGSGGAETTGITDKQAFYRGFDKHFRKPT